MSNLLVILAAVTERDVADVAGEFSGQGYGALKSAVADAVVAFAEPFAKRTNELLGDPAELDRILGDGADRAREIAHGDGGRRLTTGSACCPSGTRKIHDDASRRAHRPSASPSRSRSRMPPCSPSGAGASVTRRPTWCGRT